MAKTGARSSGGGATRRIQKDKEMAAELKRRGIRRVDATCPICMKTISLAQLYKHIALHK